MRNKSFLILLFVCIMVSALLIGNGVTQSFQHLYAIDIQLSSPSKGSILLSPAATARSGLSTITIPDITGNLITSMSTSIPSTNIACWTSTGQLGKCTTSISGVNCSTCA